MIIEELEFLPRYQGVTKGASFTIYNVSFVKSLLKEDSSMSMVPNRFLFLILAGFLLLSTSSPVFASDPNDLDAIEKKIKKVEPGWTSKYFQYNSKIELIKKMRAHRAKHKADPKFEHNLENGSIKTGSATFGAVFLKGAKVIVKVKGGWQLGTVLKYIPEKIGHVTKLKVQLSKTETVAVAANDIRISLDERFPYQP